MRIRPLNQLELGLRAPNNLPTEVVMLNPSMPNVLSVAPEGKTFAFDRVFNPHTTQEQVFEHVVSPLLDKFYEGNLIYYDLFF